MLKKGDAILKLANTDEELNLATRKRLYLASKHKCKYRITTPSKIPSPSLTKWPMLTMPLKRLNVFIILIKNLYEQKAIGLQEYQASENAYDYAVCAVNV
jgi:HlyD family secretion protein